MCVAIEKDTIEVNSSISLTEKNDCSKFYDLICTSHRRSALEKRINVDIEWRRIRFFSSFSHPLSIEYVFNGLLSCWFLSRAISVRLNGETAIPQKCSNHLHSFWGEHFSFYWFCRFVWRLFNINDIAERETHFYLLKTNPFDIRLEAATQPAGDFEPCKRIRESTPSMISSSSIANHSVASMEIEAGAIF